MIGFTAKVTYNGGPDEGAVHEGRITSSVLMQFERKHKQSVIKVIGTDMLFEPLLWLGWETIRQAGTVVKPFDDWVQINDPGVELVSPAPLGEMPPPDSSPL
jgi:hypothetical protein